MSVSRITAWMIQTNEVVYVETPERSECWIVKDGQLHALMLSCPHEDREKMEQYVNELKQQGATTP